MNCDLTDGGCNGGWLSSTMNYLLNYGVVDEQCMPYDSGDSGITGKCNYHCNDKAFKYKKYGCRAGSLRITFVFTFFNKL